VIEIRQSNYAPGLRQRRHAHDYSNITIVTAGLIEEASDAGTFCARPFSVVVKAAGCEHEDRVGGFGAMTLSIRLRSAPSISWRWMEEPAVVRKAIAVCRTFQRGAQDDLDRATALLAEEVEHVDAPAAAPAWLQKTRVILDERFDESLRFDDLARDFGLHPVYFSRAFRRYTGLSMSEYVRAARLRHARHVLSSSRRNVAAIAAESGFSDSSHLCRTFSTFLGVTPQKYRQLTFIRFNSNSKRTPTLPS
jgi:AraC-like DNA-binding protein